MTEYISGEEIQNLMKAINDCDCEDDDPFATEEEELVQKWINEGKVPPIELSNVRELIRLHMCWRIVDGYKAGFKDGINEAFKDEKKKDIRNAVYNTGFNDGLIEAWEAIKKVAVICSWNRGNPDIDYPLAILWRCSPSEVINELRKRGWMNNDK